MTITLIILSVEQSQNTYVFKQQENIHLSSYVYNNVKALFCIILSSFIINGHAQMINTAASYRSLHQDTYVRFRYENDFFTSTDKYYTQGVNLEFVSPAIAKLPSNILLIRSANTQHGISIQHNAYTPTKITDASIRYDDRPYASSLLLQQYTINTSAEKRQRLTTTFSIGVIGKIAGGQWMQETIHRNTNNKKPLGWQYQIANDLALNYRLFYEKSLFHIRNILEVSASGLVDMGTLNTQAAVGSSVMLGYFNSPYSTHNREFDIYLYGQSSIHLIGYDATLQGGLLNRSSIYTLNTNEIERAVGEASISLVIRYKKMQLEYFHTYNTKRFASSIAHAWGGFMLGLGL